MAKISFNEFQGVSANSDAYEGGGISFFSLKQDGEEAVVRIMHDSTDDFDIVGCHPIELDGKYRKVECLRGPNDPVESCPFCKAGTKFQYRFYVHMIQYVKDEQGNIVGKPVVWDRAAKQMAQELAGKLNEYGPLSECIFKIRRNGQPKDMKTTYSINFANPMVYKPEMYPKDTEVFKDYTVCGKQIMSKSYEDLQYFLTNGSFPATQPAQNPQPAAPQQGYVQAPPTNTAPVAQPASQNGNLPWNSAPQAPAQRPNRNVYY